MGNNLTTGLTLVSRNIRPLAGGIVQGTSFYDHIATVHHQPTNQFFVAYQDAKVPLACRTLWGEARLLRDKRGRSLVRQLADNQTHQIYIDKVTRCAARTTVIPRISSWLEPIENAIDFAFVARFLIEQEVIDPQMEMLILQK